MDRIKGNTFFHGNKRDGASLLSMRQCDSYRRQAAILILHRCGLSKVMSSIDYSSLLGMCRLTLTVYELLTSCLEPADITTEKPINSPTSVSISVKHNRRGTYQ